MEIMVFNMDGPGEEQARDSRHSLWHPAGVHRLLGSCLSFLEILSSVTLACVTHTPPFIKSRRRLPKERQLLVQFSRMSGGLCTRMPQE